MILRIDLSRATPAQVLEILKAVLAARTHLKKRRLYIRSKR